MCGGGEEMREECRSFRAKELQPGVVPRPGMEVEKESCPLPRLPFEVENHSFCFLFDTGSYVAQAGTGCSRG